MTSNIEGKFLGWNENKSVLVGATHGWRTFTNQINIRLVVNKLHFPCIAFCISIVSILFQNNKIKEIVYMTIKYTTYIGFAQTFLMIFENIAFD